MQYWLLVCINNQHKSPRNIIGLMLVLRSMKNQEGGLRSHNMTKTMSSNWMWINRWLDCHQTKKIVNQDFLDVEAWCNEWIIYWNKMDSILNMDGHMYFNYKKFNKTRGTYIYEDKRKRKHDLECILQLWRNRAIMNEKFCICIWKCYFSHW